MKEDKKENDMCWPDHSYDKKVPNLHPGTGVHLDNNGNKKSDPGLNNIKLVQKETKEIIRKQCGPGRRKKNIVLFCLLKV